MAGSHVDLLYRRIAIAVVAVCVVTLAATAAMSLPGVRARLGTDRLPPSYVVGSQIDVPSNVYSSGSRTVVLFSRADCAVCQRSKTAFAGVVTDFSGRSDIRVALVAPAASANDEVGFARAVGLTGDRVILGGRCVTVIEGIFTL